MAKKAPEILIGSFSPFHWTSQAPKVLKDSNSSCDPLSENWHFALAELNSSHYMAVCIEDDSRTSGLYLNISACRQTLLLYCSLSLPYYWCMLQVLEMVDYL